MTQLIIAISIIIIAMFCVVAVLLIGSRKAKNPNEFVIMFLGSFIGGLFMIAGLLNVISDFKTINWIETDAKLIVLSSDRQYRKNIVTDYSRYVTIYRYTYEYTDKNGVVHRGKNMSKDNNLPTIDKARYNPNNYSESEEGTFKSSIISDLIFLIIGIIFLLITWIPYFKRKIRNNYSKEKLKIVVRRNSIIKKILLTTILTILQLVLFLVMSTELEYSLDYPFLIPYIIIWVPIFLILKKDYVKYYIVYSIITFIIGIILLSVGRINMNSILRLLFITFIIPILVGLVLDYKNKEVYKKNK
ncbi:MAG: hypothetical protein IJ105_03810 [Bacilli bacterium]|nr:hypothetical protein [Bacilli bacterium]